MGAPSQPWPKSSPKRRAGAPRCHQRGEEVCRRCARSLSARRSQVVGSVKAPAFANHNGQTSIVQRDITRVQQGGVGRRCFSPADDRGFRFAAQIARHGPMQHCPARAHHQWTAMRSSTRCFARKVPRRDQSPACRAALSAPPVVRCGRRRDLLCGQVVGATPHASDRTGPSAGSSAEPPMKSLRLMRMAYSNRILMPH
jgi:hypothetical protein